MKKFIIQAWSIYKARLAWTNLTGDFMIIFLTPAIMVVIYALLGKFAMGTQAAQMLALGFSLQLMQGT